jgi:hypothetical protein
MEKRDKLRKIELFVAVCLLLVGMLTFFSYPGITGHVPTDLSTQKVDFMIDKSQILEMTTTSAEPFYITSLLISGEVEGDGVVEVYLDNGQGQQLLVFSNIRDKAKGLKGMTGITTHAVNVAEEEKTGTKLMLTPAGFTEQSPAANLTEEQEVFNSGFEGGCVDTCFIEMEMAKELGYNLIFKIESGTKLHLTKIQYTVRE